VLAPACQPVQQGGLGYRAVVVNFRGCQFPFFMDPRVSSMEADYPAGAGVPVTSPQLYSAGHTDDLRQALFYISHRYPEAPLLGLSFSLGANVMTRYVAEEGERSRLKSACILGCVRDYESLSFNGDNSFLKEALEFVGECLQVCPTSFLLIGAP